MMRPQQLPVILLAFVFLMVSCRGDFKDVHSVYLWINTPENGMVKVKTVEGVKLTVKYLPAEFLALKEAKADHGNQHTYDSLLEIYKASHTFLLSIAATENADENDLMYQDLSDFSDYKQRAQTMNFEMNEYVSIKTSRNEFRPVLTSMENTYSLKGQRNIYLVFTDDSIDKQLMKEDELDFVFTDEIFKTGVNHFVFYQNDLRSIPTINFNNLN